MDDSTLEEVYRLCFRVVNGELRCEDALQKMREFPRFDATFLCDILECLENEVESSEDKTKKERFQRLCKSCSTVFVPEDVIRINLHSMADDTLNTRYIKTKTRLFYKQLKFNLLREESEGYGKLITELAKHSGSFDSPHCVLERIRCLIGQFNLDPNRVLDIILECFECHLESATFFVEVLRMYGSTSANICSILGFKLSCQSDKDIPCSATATSTADFEPQPIFRLAALLIHYNLLDMLSLCRFLTPRLEAILEEVNTSVVVAGQKQKKMSYLSTAVEKDVAGNGSQHFPDCTTDGSQKLDLLCCLLEIGEWKHAKALFDRLPEFYAIRNPIVAAFFCRFVDHLIADFYEGQCAFYCISSDEPSPTPSRLYGFDLMSELKRCASFVDFVKTIFPKLHYLGPNIAVCPSLLTKIIRLCCCLLSAVSKDCNEIEGYKAAVVDLCDDVIVPSLSLLKCNCALSEEVWLLVSQFPYATRYRFYGRWKNEHVKRHPQLIVKKGEILGKTRYVMKRLSKETTKQAGRQLGKFCHSFPVIVFEYMLNQIQQFENLIGPVVESLRYLTNLSYDALTFCIIESLSSPQKEKLKVSDATISPWLQSLAYFVGSVFKKYSADLTGVLQYVANQLKMGKSFDLLVLREIVENMSGIETTNGLTQEQLEALAGGDLLKLGGGCFGQVRNTKRSVSRLKEALLQEDLVVSLCILMAQQRACIIFHESQGIHLKLAGQMLDQCQETLVQFANFLSTSLKSEDYAKRMPSAPDLMSAYHLGADAAMFLTRPAYNFLISSKYDELKKVDRANRTFTPDRKVLHYRNACSHVLDPLANEIASVYPPSVWSDLSPRCFISFWMLSMYDLNVPIASYEREIDKMRRLVQQLEESRDIGEAKRRKEKERYQQYENKLSEEQRRQMDHVNRVISRLVIEKDDWFPAKSPRSASVTQLLQLCVFPRCLFSDLDAIFCAKFLERMHSLKTKNFSTLICYDRIFGDISPVIASMSENEANHYGHFLCASLDTIMRWHESQEKFDNECANFPGFITRFRNAMTINDPAKDVVDYENYRHVVHKWHFKITKSLLVSLGSGSFVPIRNALLVLIKILPHYPIVKQFTVAVEKKVVQIRDEEKGKRQDLHVLAASYWGHLKVRKKPCLAEAEFHALQTKDVSKKPAVPVQEKSTEVTVVQRVSTESTEKPNEAEKCTEQPKQVESARDVATENGVTDTSPASTASSVVPKAEARVSEYPATAVVESVTVSESSRVRMTEIKAIAVPRKPVHVTSSEGSPETMKSSFAKVVWDKGLIYSCSIFQKMTDELSRWPPVTLVHKPLVSENAVHCDSVAAPTSKPSAPPKATVDQKAASHDTADRLEVTEKVSSREAVPAEVPVEEGSGSPSSSSVGAPGREVLTAALTVAKTDTAEKKVVFREEPEVEQRAKRFRVESSETLTMVKRPESMKASPTPSLPSRIPLVPESRTMDSSGLLALRDVRKLPLDVPDSAAKRRRPDDKSSKSATSNHSTVHVSYHREIGGGSIHEGGHESRDRDRDRDKDRDKIDVTISHSRESIDRHERKTEFKTERSPHSGGSHSFTSSSSERRRREDDRSPADRTKSSDFLMERKKVFKVIKSSPGPLTDKDKAKERDRDKSLSSSDETRMKRLGRRHSRVRKK